MSTKSTIFLTNDKNEHCYNECSEAHYIDDKFIGFTINLEIDKDSFLSADENLYNFEFNPETDMYNVLNAISYLPEIKMLLSEIIKYEETNFIESDLLKKINKYNNILENITDII